ncbi:MAG: HlyC/CorC family transporter [Acetobacteraceae bacterium]|nr:HlyC/CorC family transporter [Acetobacteraceae bacterium]
MSGTGRLSAAAKLRALFGRRAAEPTVRESIAELVQEAADADDDAGQPEDTDASPELDRHERKLIANVLELRAMSADDVMVPRADIVAMRADVTLEQAIAQIREEGHSRLPVYREQLDEIVGMVHIKDVFGYAGNPDTFSLEPLLRRPLMIAPQVPVLDLLLQMRQSRVHLALVVDEYGGIDGLLTIEDLVETIVGDISDEHDEVVGPMVTERPDGSLDVNARMPVEDFEQRIGPILTEGERVSDIDTVGGLVFRIAGRVPARGEIVGHASGLEFRVLDADPRRIRRVRVRPPPPSTPASAAAEAAD